MAPKPGDKKSRGNPEAQQASDTGSEAAQGSPERREGRRRGGRRKEAGAAVAAPEQPVAPDRQRKRGRGKTGELQRAGQPAPTAEAEAPPGHGQPQTVAHATPQVVAQPEPEPAPEAQNSSLAESTAERRTVPPSIPAPPPSARAPGFHVITEGPPVLNRTEPPVPTLRAGEAPPPRDLPGSLARALEDLPTPFSAFLARWNRAGSDTGRALAIAAGMDASARLLCAAWLGVLSTPSHPRWRTEAGNAIVSRAWYRRELPASSWMKMNFHIASIIAAQPEGTLGNVARALSDAGGLAEDVTHALDNLGPNAAGDPESLLVELFASLLSLCRPLRDTRLVGFGRRTILAGEGEAQWNLREMKGPEPSSELKTEWHTGPVAPGSCHLILPDDSRVPLAPLLSAQPCLDCSTLEVHAADMLVFGATDRAVRCLRCGRSSKDRSAYPHLRGLESSVRMWSPL